MTQTILMLPGDGIGPEVLGEAERVAKILCPDITFEYGLVGGASYDVHGVPLSDDALAQAKKSNAVLLGAVGGPKWNDVGRDVRPEAGLLNLRTGLDLSLIHI